MRAFRAFITVVSLSAAFSSPAFAQPFDFVAFDVQCPSSAAASDCPAGLAPGQAATQTSPRGVNARGDVVGLYVAGGKQHGFLRVDGQFTSLDFPLPGVRATIANGINPRGEIVGQYILPVNTKDAHGNDLPEDSPVYCSPNLPSPPNPPNTPDPACTKGFHYWHGKFTTVMFPATIDDQGNRHVHPGTIAQRITPDGDIYGCLHDHDLGASMFGAALTRGGAFSLTSNGGEVSDGMAVPMSMNNGGTPGGGTIVGFAMDMSSRQHGYVVRDGMLEPYDPTLATNLTATWDINTNQAFVGTYRETNEPTAKRHAFVQHADGSSAMTFDFTCQDVNGCPGLPFGTVAFATVAFGINPDGVVVGQYVPASGGTPHGFVATPR